MKPEVRADLHRRTLEALNGTRPEGRAAPGEVPVLGDHELGRVGAR